MLKNANFLNKKIYLIQENLEIKHRGDAVLRNICANRILIKKSNKYNWLSKGAHYYKNYWLNKYERLQWLISLYIQLKQACTLKNRPRELSESAWTKSRQH